jgi:hypothetical protein
MVKLLFVASLVGAAFASFGGLRDSGSDVQQVLDASLSNALTSGNETQIDWCGLCKDAVKPYVKTGVKTAVKALCDSSYSTAKVGALKNALCNAIHQPAARLKALEKMWLDGPGCYDQTMVEGDPYQRYSKPCVSATVYCKQFPVVVPDAQKALLPAGTVAPATYCPKASATEDVYAAPAGLVTDQFGLRAELSPGLTAVVGDQLTHVYVETKGGKHAQYEDEHKEPAYIVSVYVSTSKPPKPPVFDIDGDNEGMVKKVDLSSLRLPKGFKSIAPSTPAAGGAAPAAPPPAAPAPPAAAAPAAKAPAAPAAPPKKPGK